MSQSSMQTSATDYQAQFETWFANFKANPARLEEFLHNPQPFLHGAGIPVLAALPHALMAPVAAGSLADYQIDFKLAWWGIDVTMNEELTQAIISGLIVGAPLVSLITTSLAALEIVTAPIAAVIAAALAASFAVKVAEIKLVDEGDGVHWPISWLQWAAVVAAVPAGPAGVIAAILVFIHPLKN